MRYESFYPFVHQPPPSVQQQNVNRSPFPSPYQQNMNQFPTNRFNESLPNPASEQNGPSKFENYMQTADRFLSTAQQFAPLVQQFAPMMTNLPAMWRLYKGFQSMPNNPPSTTAARTTAPVPPTSTAVNESGPRPSMPKIFQPPTP